MSEWKGLTVACTLLVLGSAVGLMYRQVSSRRTTSRTTIPSDCYPLDAIGGSQFGQSKSPVVGGI